MANRFKIAYSSAMKHLHENKAIKRIVCIYSGRFQPFHTGHYAVYNIGVKEFGQENTFIGTSNKTDEESSPFNFEEKKRIMTTFFDDIPEDNIIEVKNPYNPTEILSKFDDDSTAMVVLLGKKDGERLINGKYYLKYEVGMEMESYLTHGYVYIVPMQEDGISGTDFRDEIRNSDNVENTLKDLYNVASVDKSITKIVKSKLNRQDPKMSFKQFLAEEEKSENVLHMEKLLGEEPFDEDFLKTIMPKPASLESKSISLNDVNTLTYKREIRKAILDSYFSISRLKKDFTFLTDVDQDTLNTAIEHLKTASFADGFDKLVKFKISGAEIGPGEMLLYFLIDDAILIAGQGEDLKVGNTTYEVKAVKSSKDSDNSKIYDFRIGNKAELQSLSDKLFALAKKYYPKEVSEDDTGKKKNVPGSVIDKLREFHAKKFAPIEAEYKKHAEKYFDHKKQTPKTESMYTEDDTSESLSHGIILYHQSEAKIYVRDRITSKHIQISRIGGGSIIPHVSTNIMV